MFPSILPRSEAPAEPPKQFKWQVKPTGSSEATALGKGSHGHASQAGERRGHNLIVVTDDVGSSEATLMGKGSHGHASQAGEFRGHQKIVTTNEAASSEPTFLGTGSYGRATAAGAS